MPENKPAAAKRLELMLNDPEMADAGYSATFVKAEAAGTSYFDIRFEGKPAALPGTEIEALDAQQTALARQCVRDLVDHLDGTRAHVPLTPVHEALIAKARLSLGLASRVSWAEANQILTQDGWTGQGGAS